mmetsp:Transcript_16354/g.50777  ORF Transcript_16354/g.50777 Transcript_16354/m.50777 type:complete len:203 (-) Transcript_16354:448-1056(-)
MCSALNSTLYAKAVVTSSTLDTVSTASNSGSLSSCRSRLYVLGRPLHSVSSVTSDPITRALLPRTISIGSGFFFCGMMLEPVLTLSAGVMKENSSLAHSTHSSPSRLRCMPMMLSADTNSITKSRSITLSTLLAVGPSKPSACAVACRSMGSPVPAMAHAPRGHRLARARQSLRRPASRSSCSTYASSRCCSRMGCARCRCV